MKSIGSKGSKVCQNGLFWRISGARIDSGVVEVIMRPADILASWGQLAALAGLVPALPAQKHFPDVAASRRLDQEFLAYSALRTWKGVAIPRIFGMYTSTDEMTKVLLMSDAGKTLRDFGDLEPAEKHLFFTRLVHLHQRVCILHNDIEPRNVTLSETSGPLVIDFDEASFNHLCLGASCKELRRLAEALQLDATAEIGRNT
ncbi:hypothetical protein C8R47DRAFT_221872 [Mycena vitilis]|nr:hypothetical protein C8R47DRAFT_221872 [Mycena vitilis]